MRKWKDAFIIATSGKHFVMFMLEKSIRPWNFDEKEKHAMCTPRSPTYFCDDAKKPAPRKIRRTRRPNLNIKAKNEEKRLGAGNGHKAWKRGFQRDAFSFSGWVSVYEIISAYAFPSDISGCGAWNTCRGGKLVIMPLQQLQKSILSRGQERFIVGPWFLHILLMKILTNWY